MGGSMGGTGTWCQLSYFPGFYAAAMPVAGNPTGMNAVNVATTPVLTVMGTADNMMSIPAVESFMSEVIAAGGTVRLDTGEGWSHTVTCEESYTAERLDWLFAQSRNSAQSIRNLMLPGDEGDSVCYDLFGRRVSRPSDGLYILNGKKVLLNP